MNLLELIFHVKAMTAQKGMTWTRISNALDEMGVHGQIAKEIKACVRSDGDLGMDFWCVEYIHKHGTDHSCWTSEDVALLAAIDVLCRWVDEVSEYGTVEEHDVIATLINEGNYQEALDAWHKWQASDNGLGEAIEINKIQIDDDIPDPENLKVELQGVDE